MPIVGARAAPLPFPVLGLQGRGAALGVGGPGGGTRDAGPGAFLSLHSLAWRLSEQPKRRKSGGLR